MCGLSAQNVFMSTKKNQEIGIHSAIPEFNERIERVVELAGIQIGVEQSKQNSNAQKRH